MGKLPLPITSRTMDDLFVPWREAIKRGEAASVLCMPKRDQFYRINSFINQARSSFKIKYCILDLSTENLEDSDNIITAINEKVDMHGQVVVFFMDADVLLKEKRQLLPFFDLFVRQKNNITPMFFFRNNITLNSYRKFLSRYSFLYLNIFFFPFFKEKDSMQFIKYLEVKFKIKIPSSLRPKIVKECGGYFWFIKEAVRHYCRTRDEKAVFDHEEMLLKLEMFFSEHDETEQRVLEKIVKNTFSFAHYEKEIVNSFLKTRLIKKCGRGWQITVPLLEKYIHDKIISQTLIGLTTEGLIMMNGVIVDVMFSRKEKRFLKQILNNPNKLFARDEAASFVWKDEKAKQFSDWALDQFVKRLRDKFGKLGLDKNRIKTVKNQGYVFNKEL